MRRSTAGMTGPMTDDFQPASRRRPRAGLRFLVAFLAGIVAVLGIDHGKVLDRRDYYWHYARITGLTLIGRGGGA